MKIRTGFVSNSSSASFVINWECYHKDATLSQALHKLFDVEEGKSEEHNSYVYDIVKDVIDQTTEHRPGVYTSNFYTTMLNWPCDFGNIAAQFIMAMQQETILRGNADYKVVSQYIEGDSV